MKFLINNLLRFMSQRTGSSRNNSGFTLVEVMVATGMLSVLSLTVAYLTKNITKVQRATEQNVTVNSLRLTAYKSLSSPDACMETLQGKSPSGVVNLPEVKDRNGNSVITAGAVYGGEGKGKNAASKLTITAITLSSYQSNGDPYRNSTTGAPDTMDGTARIVISYKKGDRVGVTSSDAKERSKSIGSVQGEISIPVSFSHEYTGPGAPGNIIRCASAAPSYGKGICDSFDGNNINDEKCRHITVNDKDPDYAVTFKGNVKIENAATDNNELTILGGSLGIGTEAETDAPGKVSVNGTLSVGLANPHSPIVGSVDLTGALGVGAPANIQQGSLKVEGSASIGLGINVSGNNGNFKTGYSLGVGAAAPQDPIPAIPGSHAGNMHVASSMGVDKIPSSVIGHLGVNGGITVGSGVANPDGISIGVEGAVRIPNQSATDNNAKHAATQYWVASKIANSLDPGVVGQVNDIINDIMGSGTDQAAAKNLCQGFRVKNAGNALVTYAPGVWDGNICSITPKYCSTDGQCNTVYAEAGGVNSAGHVLTTNGNIISNSGNISTSSGDVRAKTVRADNSLCLRGSCKTSWSAINVTSTGCYSASVGATCNVGYFISRVTLTKRTINFKNTYSVTRNYYAGNVTSTSGNFGNSSKSVGDSVSYYCCKAVNN